LIDTEIEGLLANVKSAGWNSPVPNDAFLTVEAS